MEKIDLPNLTGHRLKKFLEVIRNAPRNPACGCIVLSETARLLIEALFSEEERETGRTQKN